MLSVLIRPGDEDRRRRVNGAWQKGVDDDDDDDVHKVPLG